MKTHKTLLGMGTKQKIEYLLMLARNGDFGMPDNPNRGGSGKAHFWNAYNGLLDPDTLKGTINHPYAVAGKKFRTAASIG